MTIEASLLIQLSAIVFAAGILYSKVSSLEKRVEKMDSHGEIIATLRAKVESLEKQIL